MFFLENFKKTYIRLFILSRILDPIKMRDRIVILEYLNNYDLIYINLILANSLF